MFNPISGGGGISPHRLIAQIKSIDRFLEP